MRTNMLLLCVAMGLAFGCGRAGPRPGTGAAADGGRRLVYRASSSSESAPGDVSLESLGSVADLLIQRLNNARLKGVEVGYSASPAEISIVVPKSLADQEQRIRGLVERPGHMEMRIRAPAATEREEREERERRGVSGSAEHEVIRDAPYAWVAGAGHGGDALVCTPERPLRAALERMRAEGVAEGAPEYVAAQEQLDRTLADEVFGGVDIARAEVRDSGGGAGGGAAGSCDVIFYLSEARASAFGDFTARHVGDQVVIVVDGTVLAAPVIRSRLPGCGVISGGARAFTRAEAQDLVATLGTEGLNVTLRLVEPDGVR